ncbi:hypothetical protein [Nocardiopsis sp. MG754419]|uniref:hypothetical protein n=1 Tax=Nocardiopsis sp. MG754419 TaxID=2259865 RepID=UPI001BA45578|nr:hypothetical protein [Nocardiopsis sp. MG754419]MBR8744530.1 hypothetical protein [Nocardiopsis sp. MG754419]
MNAAVPESVTSALIVIGAATSLVSMVMTAVWNRRNGDPPLPWSRFPGSVPPVDQRRFARAAREGLRTRGPAEARAVLRAADRHRRAWENPWATATFVGVIVLHAGNLLGLGAREDGARGSVMFTVTALVFLAVAAGLPLRRRYVLRRCARVIERNRGPAGAPVPTPDRAEPTDHDEGAGDRRR